jgi:GAF domain-containing protein
MSNKAASEQKREVTTEEAALRRVATLVARESSPVEIFVAVTQESARVLECDAVGLLRFEPGDTAVLLAQSDTPWDPPPLGTRLSLDGHNVITQVFHTGEASRDDEWDVASGAVAQMAAVLGVRSAVASPVVVGGRLWGTIIAATGRTEPLPGDMEFRLAQFTEMVATAIANAEAREALARLADEQAALRRVATLVADGIGPEGIFTAVAAEVDALFGADVSAIVRFEQDGTATVLGDVGGPHMAGKRVTLDPGYVVDVVRDTGHSARFDTDDPTLAEMPSIVRALGIRSAVASPMVVEGEVWGAITAASIEGQLPSGAEQRLTDFTELVATAVSNTHAREHVVALAQEQAALRRIATLVAEDAHPEQLYRAVALEVGTLLAVDFSGIAQLAEGSVIPLATWAAEDEHPPLPAEWPMQDGDPVTAIAEAGHAVRWEDWTGVEGPIAEFIRSDLGVRSTVATPIVVEGRVWGALAVHSRQPLPPDTESRMEQFSALVATAVAGAQAQVAVRGAAEEQGALRRVATLVAGSAPPPDVFAAVTREVALVLRGDASLLCRADPDGSVVVVGTWGDPGPAAEPGFRIPRGGHNLTTLVLDSGRPARIDNYQDATGVAAEVAHSQGVRSAVGVPILVEDRVWGLAIVGTSAEEPLPTDAEERLAAFTELVATAIANAEAHEALERVATEQAALRRVATLVAAESSQDEIFSAVAEGVAAALGEELRLVRFEGGFADVVADSEGPHSDVLPVGTRLPVGGDNALSHVYWTGETTRIDEYASATGPIAEAVQAKGLRSIVATPIVVEGRTWGALIVGTFGEEPVPPGTEDRLGQFAELMATGIGNTEARAEVERLAEQETALRRLATLIAHGAEPEEVFAAVTDLTAATFDAITAVMRFEHDPPENVIVGVSKVTGIPIGTRWPLAEGMTSTEVFRTGRSARLGAGDWPSLPGAVGEAGLRFRIISQVACPIVVEGTLWGVITVNASEELPPDTEERLEKFTELVTTAIANASGRAELVASRARIVAAGDEARRRIERNLHDGTQQRLIALGLDLQRARAAIPEDQHDTLSALGGVESDLEAILGDLRELSHGLHPPLLSRLGLGPSLQALARRSPIPVSLDVELRERPESSLETAMYYVVSEALTNAIKHSHASEISITISRGAALDAQIEDDGIGGADPAGGSGLTGLSDRVNALGGRFAFDSPAGGGTRISVELPIEP